MKLTLATVTHPPNIAELRACVESVRRFGPPVEWLFFTEAENLDRIKEALPGEPRVYAMSRGAEDIPSGFFRQQCAKMEAAEWAEPGGIMVFLDDDVLSLKSWSESLFTRGGEEPILFYLSGEMSPWAASHFAIFGKPLERIWEFALPMALKVDTLRNLNRGKVGKMLRDLWQRDIPASEFQTFGEHAFQMEDGSRFWRCSRWQGEHWTLHKGIFKDYRRQRQQMRQDLNIQPAKLP